MPSGDRPFLCGLEVGQPQCPQLFDCIVQPGNKTSPSGCPSSAFVRWKLCQRPLIVSVFFRSRLRSLLHGRRSIAETGKLPSQRDGPGVRLRSALHKRHGMPRSRQVLPERRQLRRKRTLRPSVQLFSLRPATENCPAAQFDRARRQRLHPAMRSGRNEILCPPVQPQRTRLLVRRSLAGHKSQRIHGPGPRRCLRRTL